MSKIDQLYRREIKHIVYPALLVSGGGWMVVSVILLFLVG